MSNSGITRLSESLENVSKNTMKILTKLQHFEDRLSNIDGYISSIREETLEPSKAKKNLDNTLIEIERVNEYYQVGFDVEPVVVVGLKNSSSQSHDDYYLAVERLALAKNYFDDNVHMKGGASLIKINGLLSMAIQSCAAYLEQILREMDKSVEEKNGVYKAVYPLDEAASRGIRGISKTLFEARTNVHFKIYTSFRLKAVSAALKDVETSANVIAAYTEGPYQKDSHILTRYFAMLSELLKSEVVIASNTLVPQDTQECTEVLVKIIGSAVEELGRVVSSSLLIGAETKKYDGDILFQSNRFLVQLDVLQAYLQRYHDLWDACRADAPNFQFCGTALLGLKELIATNCMRGMAHLLLCIFDEKNSSSISRPDSCDASNMTVHVLHCCRELKDFSAAYQMLLDHMTHANKEKQQQAKVVSPPPSPSVFVCNLIGRLLRYLDVQKGLLHEDVPTKSTYQTLLSQSLGSHSMYDSGEKDALLRLQPARKHLFMLNNMYLVALFLAERDVELSKQQSSAERSGVTELLASVKKRITEEQGSFCSTVVKALGLATEDVLYSKQFEKDAASKNKVLKAKFSCFNSGLDALISKRGEWRLANNADLRQSLNEQLKHTIVSPFSLFFSENCRVQFSKKHAQQYLRFPPSEVDRLLAQYF